MSKNNRFYVNTTSKIKMPCCLHVYYCEEKRCVMTWNMLSVLVSWKCYHIHLTAEICTAVLRHPYVEKFLMFDGMCSSLSSL